MNLNRTHSKSFAKFIMLAIFSTSALTLSACSDKNTTIVQGDMGGSGSGDSDGVGSGGGGDVVVCYDARGEIIDMESYDIWVGPFHSAMTFDRKPVGENVLIPGEQDRYMEHVAAALGKLGRLDPIFSARLNAIAQEFIPQQIAEQEEVSTTKKIHKVPALTSNGDSGATVTPATTSKCSRLVQERMFWQVDNPLPLQYRYQLVERLWNKASAAVRAAVVMHETIWRFERQLFDPDTSIRAQYFNALIHSNEFETYSPEQYLEILKRLSYPDEIQTVSSLAPDKGDDKKVSFTPVDPTSEPGTEESSDNWSNRAQLSVVYKNITFAAESLKFGTPDDNFIVRGQLASRQPLNIEGERVTVPAQACVYMDQQEVVHLCRPDQK